MPSHENRLKKEKNKKIKADFSVVANVDSLRLFIGFFLMTPILIRIVTERNVGDMKSCHASSLRVFVETFGDSEE
jgi:hypothetical protein